MCTSSLARHSAYAKCDIHILKSDLNMEMLSWLYLLDGGPLEQMLRSWLTFCHKIKGLFTHNEIYTMITDILTNIILY